MIDPTELERFRRGDETYFREIVDAYSPRLLALVSSFARDRDQAHDLLQDAWVRVYQKREAYSGRGSLLAWILSVARNVCLGAVRAERARLSLTAARAVDLPAGSAGADELLNGVDRARLTARVNQILLELTDRELQVVTLRILHERSTPETAEALDCAQGTVRALLHRALTKLRTRTKEWMT